ncbi:Crp/Fnr family transcriptional regulator [Myroides sp. M-43]|uniref:Crp/Fnr family transcriptional regulator n=1 Tax=Myroides oncorhynchi TaxID=2893756 RepID=UPI001E47765D|nr:Crp/Fnr family transcriptional regulator [Myroides oncorhynchi]MCC9041419.1 Crp/Fnr family transcriptional regulator [Myroides oncorhynchi]
MDKASLIDNFERKGVILTTEEKELILASFQTVHVKKKDYLLKAGEVCDFEAFVIQGCFKKYCLDDKGDEHIIHFSIEDWWISDLESYNNGLPSRTSIQALEDSEILFITKEVKEALYDQVSGLERIYRRMTQQECAALQRRIINKLSMNATEEYEYFCNRYPSLLKRLTNIQIASYLGISQEFLSKIRSKKKM